MRAIAEFQRAIIALSALTHIVENIGNLVHCVGPHEKHVGFLGATSRAAGDKPPK